MAIVYIDKTPPKPIGVGEDMGRSALTGLAEGVVSIPGAVGDLRGLGESVAGWLTEQMGRNRPTMSGLVTGQKRAPPPKMGDASPLQTLMTMTAEKVAKRYGVDPRVGKIVAAMLPGNMGNAPTSAELLGTVTQDKPLYKPQTKAGEYARTIAAFAPAATMPGTAVQRVARVVVPGAASETAGQFTKGQPIEPYARLAGAIAGAGVTELATMGAPRERLLANASQGATDAQIADARVLMEQAQQQGVPLTMSEALQRVTNGGTGMGRMQRILEGTEAGNARIAPVMAERPGQVRQAVSNFADTIAPASDSPSMLGAQAQESAEAALTGVRQGINEQARPFYDNLPGELLPENDYAALAGDASYQAGLSALRNNPELNARYADLPDNDLSVINAVIKRLNTTAEQVRPSPVNVQGADNELASLRDSAAQSAREMASRASPDFEAARQIVADGRAQNLEPLQRGPLGAISQTPDVRAQTSALFPAAPIEGQPAETRLALEMMGGPMSDPARGLVRQQLVNSANEATQDLTGGQNQWGGAKWAAGQFGNPEQAATMRAGVQAVGGHVGELGRLVDVLAATGMRERPGSMTAYNARAIEELGQAGMTGEVLRTGLNPPGVFRRLGQGFQNWQTETNAGRLAEAILAEPAEAEAILLRAREVVPPGRELQAIEQAALAAQLSRRPQLEQSNGSR